MAAALAAVQFIFHFGFVENCKAEFETLEELIKSESNKYVEEGLTDDEKRELRIKDSMAKGEHKWR